MDCSVGLPKLCCTSGLKCIRSRNLSSDSSTVQNVSSLQTTSIRTVRMYISTVNSCLSAINSFDTISQYQNDAQTSTNENPVDLPNLLIHHIFRKKNCSELTRIHRTCLHTLISYQPTTTLSAKTLQHQCNICTSTSVHICTCIQLPPQNH